MTTAAAIHFVKTSIMRSQVYGYAPDMDKLRTLLLDSLQAAPPGTQVWIDALWALGKPATSDDELLYDVWNVLAA